MVRTKGSKNRTRGGLAANECLNYSFILLNLVNGVSVETLARSINVDERVVRAVMVRLCDEYKLGNYEWLNRVMNNFHKEDINIAFHLLKYQFTPDDE
jgi:hypothetical protein